MGNSKSRQWDCATPSFLVAYGMHYHQAPVQREMTEPLLRSEGGMVDANGTQAIKSNGDKEENGSGDER
jgi:hypothetical protein